MKCIVKCWLVATILIAAQDSVSHAGLTGWWKFDEGTGSTAADSSPSGTTGNITNAAAGGLGPGGSVWVNDATRGSVISFNGLGATGAYVRAGNIPTMDLTSDFTWAFWANQDAANSTSPNDIIFGNRMNETPADFVPRQFIKFTPTQFEWHMNGNGNDNLNYDDIPGGQWMHHAVVKDGDLITYYRNGVASGSKTITQGLAVPQPLYFGGDNEKLDGENWRGLMDDARIYDNALSSGEVAALVPEPSALALLLLGLFALPRRRVG